MARAQAREAPREPAATAAIPAAPATAATAARFPLATGSITGSSASGGAVNLAATGTGGNGGGTPSGSGNAGNGANVSLTNVVSGSTTGGLTLAQTATGGNGGTTSGRGTSGVGGAATNSLTQTTTSTSMNASTTTTGGNGGGLSAASGKAATGGAATATTSRHKQRRHGHEQCYGHWRHRWRRLSTAPMRVLAVARWLARREHTSGMFSVNVSGHSDGWRGGTATGGGLGGNETIPIAAQATASGNGGKNGTIQASATLPSTIGSAMASGPTGGTVGTQAISQFNLAAPSNSMASGLQAASYLTVSPLQSDVTNALAGDTHLSSGAGQSGNRYWFAV